MSDSNNVIDLTYLESISDGDYDIVFELIDIFLEQIVEFTRSFEESFSNKNWKNLAAMAHKAKSSVISMGMEELGNVDLKNMELICKFLLMRELENKSNINLKEKEELELLKKSFSANTTEKQTWITDNASEDVILKIIDRFSNVCQMAKEELTIFVERKKIC